MTTSPTPETLPSRSRLAKATLLALVAAAIILITTVLPAEHGLDPTGIGQKLGLLAMSSADTEATSEPVTELPQPDPVSNQSDVLVNQYVVQSSTPFRSEEMSVTLPANKGAEIKAKMQQGAQFTFAWSTDAGPVEFDMHGEETGAAKDVFTSYWRADAQNGSGTFSAPFDGSHGWYWHNHGTEPVTVAVQVSGFYSELFQP